MDIGEMRDRIILQKKKEQQGPIPNLDKFEDYKSIWSKVKFLKDREFWQAKASNSETVVEFTIRHREDLDKTMRIVYDKRNFNIDGVIPVDNKKMYLIVMASEVVNSGV
ncbi:hypothetical protein 10S12_17 [uncultured Caudovirales phage]|uniref:Head-tail adaptor n=1 Tax=uncultured Caudovirales phage TaxID=2100421 RepID=A0A2H4JCB1_9CAUD|nr:hypothetical protein 10S12_17 [uncultured Caudovirales phage]